MIFVFEVFCWAWSPGSAQNCVNKVSIYPQDHDPRHHHPRWELFELLSGYLVGDENEGKEVKILWNCARDSWIKPWVSHTALLIAVAVTAVWAYVSRIYVNSPWNRRRLYILTWTTLNEVPTTTTYDYLVGFGLYVLRLLSVSNFSFPASWKAHKSLFASTWNVRVLFSLWMVIESGSFLILSGNCHIHTLKNCAVDSGSNGGSPAQSLLQLRPA